MARCVLRVLFSTCTALFFQLHLFFSFIARRGRQSFHREASPLSGSVLLCSWERASRWPPEPVPIIPHVFPLSSSCSVRITAHWAAAFLMQRSHASVGPSSCCLAQQAPSSPTYICHTAETAKPLSWPVTLSPTLFTTVVMVWHTPVLGIRPDSVPSDLGTWEGRTRNSCFLLWLVLVPLRSRRLRCDSRLSVSTETSGTQGHSFSHALQP